MKYRLQALFCMLFLTIPLYLRAAVVIQYHHIDDDTPAITSVPLKLFEQHMDYLAEHDFKVWPLPRLISTLRQGRPLPDKVIAITFDDGYSSVYRNALPVLRRHGFPFTVFVTTRLVGSSSDFMSWDQLRDAVARGGSIGNHTASHPHLVRLRENETPQHWQQRITQQISTAEKSIRNHMGHSEKLLAYPYGEYDSRVETIVRRLGLVGFGQQSGAFDDHADWQALPRFPFGGDYGAMQGFIDKVNSLPMPLEDAYISDARGRRLADPLLPLDTARPTLNLLLTSPELAKSVQCFASGQGRIATRVDGRRVATRPEHALPVGRSRINCTAASGRPGRFYWYSQFLMRKQDDGRWYREP